MCSRPASPNCPGSVFTSIRHFPPVIVANAHCTPLMIGEHTREKKPFYNSIFFHRRPYRLKLPLPRSDNSFALLAPTGFLHRVYSGLIRPAVHLLFHPLFWQSYFLSLTTRTRTLKCKLTKYTKYVYMYMTNSARFWTEQNYAKSPGNCPGPGCIVWRSPVP